MSTDSKHSLFALLVNIPNGNKEIALEHFILTSNHTLPAYVVGAALGRFCKLSH